MNTFQLIRVTHEHIEILRELSIVTFTDTYAQYNTPEDMQQYIAAEFSWEKLGTDAISSDSAFYLALDEQTPIGFVKVNYAPAQTDLHDAESLELERIYVLKEYQGKKAGQFLLDAALNIALENDFNYLWLGVWDKNINAQQFYAKNGFVPFGTHTFMLGADEQVDILLKKPVR